MDLAKEVMGIIKKLINGQPRAFLIDVPKHYTSKEILNYYQYIEVGDVARALVLNLFATKVMRNLYFKLPKGKPNEIGRLILTKLFTKKEAAIKCLLEQIEKSKR